MDLTKALERNAQALAAIIMALGAMLRAGIIGDGRITKVLRKALLRILTPAESAVRRLIVIAARGMKGPGLIASWPPAWPWPGARAKQKDRVTRLAFPLFDTPKYHLLKPQKPALRGVPRIWTLDSAPRPQPQPSPPPDPTVDARRLYWRLDALQKAVRDIPGQARRLVRLTLRRKAASKKRPVNIAPLRPGYAPGRRKKREHPVDDILEECRHFAGQALADTS